MAARSGTTSPPRTCRSGFKSTPSTLPRTTPARPTWPPPCTSPTTSGPTSTRPLITARRGKRRQRHSQQCVHARAARRSNHRGLLVAGTETGLYVSYDDGENWKPFQLNLPVTPDRKSVVWGKSVDLGG